MISRHFLQTTGNSKEISMRTFMIFLEKKKPFTLDVIERHVQHLQRLDSEGILVLCGPFKDGMGGVVTVLADDELTASKIAMKDPFVSEGFESFQIRELEVANADNNYGL